MPTRQSESQLIADALNAQPDQATPPTTWLVMQFGLGTRPRVTCSTNRHLAIADFLQHLRMICLLFPEATFKLLGDDDDGALCGLSLYQDDQLALTLQPAGGIVPHPLFPDLPPIPATTFAEAAPLLLAAIQRRSETSSADRAAYLNSGVANSWRYDIDTVLLEQAHSESDVSRMFPRDLVDAAWRAISTSRVMTTIVVPVSTSESAEEPNPEPTPNFTLASSLSFEPQGPAEPLPVAFSSESGEPTRYLQGVELVLRCRTDVLQEELDAATESLDDALDRAPITGAIADIPRRVRNEIEAMARATIQRCPHAIEAHSLLAGILFTNEDHQASIEVAEPIARQLLSMIPDAGYVQVPYGYLKNRPFHRLIHTYVLALGKVGRDREANALAKRMLELAPSDNIGFRFLRTKAQRGAAEP